MIKIVSDTCTLYSRQEAHKIGLEVTPLSVLVDGKDYREYEDIDTATLIEKISNGAVPTSSQPSIGEKIGIYDKLTESDEVIDITIAQGLSGTYDTALMAKEACRHPDRVTVFNSGTLCGPQRALTEAALRMAKEGKSKEEILTMLAKSNRTDISFLIPMDLKFLERGGRVSKTVGNLGSLLKLLICLKKSEDGRCLEKYAIDRTVKGTVKSIFKEFAAKGVDDSYLFSISHAMNEEMAGKLSRALKDAFPRAHIDLFELSPVFLTQGGPRCCAIQAIKIIR